MTAHRNALESETQFADLGDRTLAYRVMGEGQPIILANRFRGDLDKWDPKFLDALANNYQVITFDFSGLGRSTGTQARSHLEMAKDVKNLAAFLGIKKFIMGGWSLGGFIAQVVITEYPELVSHCVLIGTRPPGKDVPPPKKLFFDKALKPVNDFNDEIILFFNPQYETSKMAASESHQRMASRTRDKDVEVTKVQWEQVLTLKGYPDDQYETAKKLSETRIPILVIAGEDDVSFPVEDWFKRKGEFPTAFLMTMPQTGHGPQHQFPELSAKFINDFISTPLQL